MQSSIFFISSLTRQKLVPPLSFLVSFFISPTDSRRFDSSLHFLYLCPPKSRRKALSFFSACWSILPSMTFLLHYFLIYSSFLRFFHTISLFSTSFPMLYLSFSIFSRISHAISPFTQRVLACALEHL